MKILATLALVGLLSSGTAMATVNNTFMANPSNHVDTSLSKDPIGMSFQTNFGNFKNDQSNIAIGFANSAWNEAKINSLKAKKGVFFTQQLNVGDVTSNQANTVVGDFNAGYNGLSANSIEMGCTTC